MLSTTIQAVLFDKDGTLIDFNYTWYPFFNRFLDELATQAHLEPAERRLAARALGDMGWGFKADSVFAQGSYDEIYEAIERALPHCTRAVINKAFSRSYEPERMDARPLGSAARTLKTLRSRGLALGVATADDLKGTRHTLDRAGLSQYLHFIGCQDTVERGKPYPDLMEAFCEARGLKPEEVAVVGDTLKDMEFARNSGAGQAFLIDGPFASDAARELADALILDIGGLLLSTAEAVQLTQALAAV